MPLAEIIVRNAKGKETQKLSDGDGLQLWVAPAGGKVGDLFSHSMNLHHLFRVSAFGECELGA